MASIWDFSNYYLKVRSFGKAVITTVAKIVVGIVTLYGLLLLFLFITNKEIVSKDSYFLKTETVNDNVLRKEAIQEIDYLIIIGENLGNDISKTNVWLLQVLVFVHAIEFKQDFTWQIDPLKGQKMSAVEADIRWILLDPSVQIQAQKTLGILKGLKSAFKVRI